MLSSSNPVTMSGPPHFVDLHVNPGESVSIQMLDGNETILRGPATITMVSQHTFPPVPMPVQVPPGHMVQQIVDENGTLRHIILSALNGQNGSSGGGGSSSTPVTIPMVQQSPPQPPSLPSAQQSSTSQSSAPTAMSTPAYPFPCCCSCCYCTSSVPAAGPITATGLSSPPALLATSGCFPAPSLSAVNSSANRGNRRTTTSRNSYSFSKRQSNNNNNSLMNHTLISGGSSLPQQPLHTSSSNTTMCSTASSQSPFPANPFHPNPLASPVKSHKSGSKSANLPTGIHHMESLSKMIIPPMNGTHGHMTQSVPHHHQYQQQHHQSQMLNHNHHLSHADSSPRKTQQTGHVNNSSSISELSAGSVASVVSDLLAKQFSPTKQNGTGSGTYYLQQSSQQRPSAGSSSTPLSLNCHSFRPSSSSVASDKSLPATSSPYPVSYSDSRLSNGLMNTSSSSVVSSTSVSPNSLQDSPDSSYASDKFSEVSSKSDSGNEIMGLVQNNAMFQNSRSSSSITLHPNTPTTRTLLCDAKPDHSLLKAKPQRSGHKSEVDADVDRHRNNTEVLSTETPVTSSCESRVRENSHSPRHKTTASVSVRGSTVPRDESSSSDNRSKKNGPLLPTAPIASNNKTLIRNSVSSQTIASTNRTVLLSSSKSQSSPPSPVILLQPDQLSARIRASPFNATGLTSSAASSSHSSPDTRKNRNKLIESDTNVPQETSAAKVDRLSFVNNSAVPASTSSQDCKTNSSHESDIRSPRDADISRNQMQQTSDCDQSIRTKPVDDCKFDRTENDEAIGAQVNGILSESHAQSEKTEADSCDAKQEQRVSSRSSNADSDADTGLSSGVSCSQSSPSSGIGIVDRGDDHGDDGEVDESESGGQESHDDAVLLSKSVHSSPKSMSLSQHPAVQLLNLTYTALTATSVKLKWNVQSAVASEPHPLLLLLQEKATGNCVTHHFIAEMLISNNSKSCPADDPSGQASVTARTVYQGSASTCRVYLQCAQQYSFRVRAVVKSVTDQSDQHLLVSNLLTITTPEQALNSKNKHRSKLQPSAPSQSQQSALHQEQQSSNKASQQPAATAVQQVTEDDIREKDDQRRAFLILLFFTGFAVVFSVIIHHLLADHVSQSWQLTGASSFSEPQQSMSPDISGPAVM